MSQDISSVTITFFIHSTEDESRLLDRVSAFLQLPEKEIQIESLTGYYGNRILSAKLHIVGEEAHRVLGKILHHLNTASRKGLVSELEKHLDEHDALYLRVDKEILMKGNQEEVDLSLTEDEAIRIKVKPKNRWGGRATILEAYRKMIEQ